VHVTLRRVDTRIEHVTGALQAEPTDGRFVARDVAGSVDIDSRRAAVDLEDLHATSKVSATDGEVTVRGLGGDLTFTGDRCGLAVSLAPDTRSVNARTADAKVEVTLAPDHGAALDLETQGGEIRLPVDTLPVTRDASQQRAKGTIWGGGAALTVRTQRADIVIRR
jgi:hypothetical protein